MSVSATQEEKEIAVASVLLMPSDSCMLYVARRFAPVITCFDGPPPNFLIAPGIRRIRESALRPDLKSWLMQMNRPWRLFLYFNGRRSFPDFHVVRVRGVFLSLDLSTTSEVVNIF